MCPFYPEMTPNASENLGQDPRDLTHRFHSRASERWVKALTILCPLPWAVLVTQGGASVFRRAAPHP